MKITDYQRELLLKSGGVIDDDENTKMHERVKLLTYAEEEEQLKAEFKAAVENCGIEADEGDLLVQRQRTAEEIAAEEDEYKKFLLESVAVRAYTLLWLSCISNNQYLRSYVFIILIAIYQLDGNFGTMAKCKDKSNNFKR